MRDFRRQIDGDDRLVVDTDDGWYDLTAARSRVTDFRTLLQVSDVSGTDVDDLVTELLEDASEVAHPEDAEWSRPVVPDEVWGAGVTYQTSEEAREAESGMLEVYLQV